MTRTPLLDGLRASYERHEAEITAPIQELLDWQTRNASLLRREMVDLHVIIGRKVGEVIFADIGRGLARALPRLISEACAKHDHSEPTFRLVLPTSELKWLNPTSLQRLVIEGYLLKLRTDRSTLKVSSRTKPLGYENRVVTVLQIDIPGLSHEQVVS